MVFLYIFVSWGYYNYFWCFSEEISTGFIFVGSLLLGRYNKKDRLVIEELAKVIKNQQIIIPLLEKRTRFLFKKIRTVNKYILSDIKELWIRHRPTCNKFSDEKRIWNKCKYRLLKINTKRQQKEVT